jgi:hypothetical protein
MTSRAECASDKREKSEKSARSSAGTYLADDVAALHWARRECLFENIDKASAWCAVRAPACARRSDARATPVLQEHGVSCDRAGVERNGRHGRAGMKLAEKR